MHETFRIMDAAGVLIHRAVVQHTLAGDVAKPGAANAGKFVGITQEAQATQYGRVAVKTGGKTFAVAYGTIAVGDHLGIGDTAGRVASNETSVVLAPGTALVNYVIGVARTAAGAQDDIIEMVIAPEIVKTAAS